MTHVELHAGLAQPAEPRAQQRRRLEILREHAPGRAHKCFDAKSTGPGSERVRPKRREQRRDLPATGTIAREKFLRRFRVREVQAAFPGQEKLATDRRHGVIEIDLCAGGTRCLRGHEPGRSSADNCNVHISPADCASCGLAHFSRSPRQSARKPNASRDPTCRSGAGQAGPWQAEEILRVSLSQTGYTLQ